MAEDNGFYYMRARYYDPSIGRFISEYPAGFEGGINLYAYVGNNPVNLIDPFGLEAQKNGGSASDAWWPKWSELFVPGYGNYGGPIRTDLTFSIPPIDSMDRLFMQHDIGWSEGRGREADKILLQELYNLPRSSNNWTEPPKNSLEAIFYRKVIAEPYFWWSNLIGNKK